MSAAARRFGAIVLADWRERTRSPRFLGVLGVTALAALWLFPPRDASYLTVAINGTQRGAYSSAWVGMVLAMVFSTVVSLAGFYVVRGTLTRDIESRVWQLLVATPMRRSTYLLAKWCSHVLTLSAIAAVTLAVGLGTQLARGEDTQIDWVELVKPLLLLSVPGFCVTATLALWFDLVPWLRRTLGNVVYFFVWIALLSLSMVQVLPQHQTRATDAWLADPGGVITFVHAVERQVLDGARLGNLNVVRPVQHDTVRTFAWPRWDVQPEDLRGGLGWLVLALVGVWAASHGLDRAAAHDTATAHRRHERTGASLRWLVPLLAPLQRSGLGTLIAAEATVVLRARRVAWWVALLLAWAVQAFAPPALAAAGVMAGWVLLLDVFAGASLREAETRTLALVYTAPDAQRRVLLARALLLTGLAWTLTLPALVHFGVTQPLAALAALAVSASLALWGLALGTLVRSPRAFELIALLLNYAGLHGLPVLNVHVAPLATLAGHLAAAPLALALLSWGWPRLCRPTR